MHTAELEALAGFALGPLVCFHGGELRVIEQVLSDVETLGKSSNKNDWLGNGIYFWVGSKERAQEWAEQKQAQGLLHKAAVVGALIYPGLCLNLLDFGVLDEVKDAYNFLLDVFSKAGEEPPRNRCELNGILVNRRLDCAVMNSVHQLRKEAGLTAYDTVLGAFEEGAPLFDGSAFREKTHLQIAVRNHSCILKYFLP